MVSLSTPSREIAGEAAEAENLSQTANLGMTWLMAIVVFLAVFHTQFPDPFVRHDDYPALLGLADGYYEKTLTEGRWLNYWWIRYVAPGSSVANYVAYALGWTLFAAAFASSVLRGTGARWTAARGLLAALVVLTPQAAEIAQWYNTLIPGVWLLAIYGCLCVVLPRRISVGLLLLFVPLTFIAYNTYPFLLFATVLLRADQNRSFKDLATVSIVFAVSFALGMALAYWLNWINHSVFGVEMGEWRQFDSFRGMTGSLAIIARLVRDFSYNYGGNNQLIGMLFFSLGLLSFLPLVRHKRLEAVYAATPLAIGMGLLLTHSLMNGIFLPIRSTAFAWVCTSYVLVRVAMLSELSRWARRIAWLVVLGIVATIGVRMYWVQGYFVEWRQTTRELADRVPDTATRIVIYGSLYQLRGAIWAGIQSEDGLSYRLQYLTGLPVTNCKDNPEDCAGFSPPFDPMPRFGLLTVETAGDTTYFRLPALEWVP